MKRPGIGKGGGQGGGRRGGQGGQRGIAAVELAIALMAFMILLAFPLLLGRYFYYYDVAQKAVRDASRYLSSASTANMRSAGRVGDELAVARAIIEAEMAGLDLGGNVPGVSFLCGAFDCTGVGLPDTVTVALQMYVQDSLFAPYTNGLTGDYGMIISVRTTMRYVGN